MKRVAWRGALALAVVAAGAAWAQDGLVMVPDDTVRQVAPLILEALSEHHANMPVKVDGVADKTVAYRAEGPALLLIPDRNLAAKAVREAGEKTVPAGVVALRALVPVADGKRVSAEKLALLTPEGQGRDVVLLFLGVKKEGANLVLEVYSKEQQPLFKAPLTAKPNPENGALPLTATFANIDKAAKQADVVVHLDGAYQANVRIAAPQ